jgi:hypothetical protein
MSRFNLWLSYIFIQGAWSRNGNIKFFSKFILIFSKSTKIILKNIF